MSYKLYLIFLLIPICGASIFGMEVNQVNKQTRKSTKEAIAQLFAIVNNEHTFEDYITLNNLNLSNYVNLKDKYGNTLLMQASAKGCKSVVKTLLNASSLIETRNTKGETALIIASKFGQKAIVELLLKRKANINAQDMFGYTALMRAVIKNDKALVQFLLNKNANTEIRNYFNETTQDLAQRYGFVKFVNMLEPEIWSMVDDESSENTTQNLHPDADILVNNSTEVAIEPLSVESQNNICSDLNLDFEVNLIDESFLDENNDAHEGSLENAVESQNNTSSDLDFEIDFIDESFLNENNDAHERSLENAVELQNNISSDLDSDNENFTCGIIDYEAIDREIGIGEANDNVNIDNSDLDSDNENFTCGIIDYEAIDRENRIGEANDTMQQFNINNDNVDNEENEIESELSEPLDPYNQPKTQMLSRLKMLICDECGYETKRADRLTDHIRGKHSNTLYRCKKRNCKFETKWPENLIRHKRIRHGKKVTYICQEIIYAKKKAVNLSQYGRKI